MTPQTPTPIQLHTIDSLCIELISGRAIGIGPENRPLALTIPASRSILYWYRSNRHKWAGQLYERDAESIVDAAALAPPNMPSIDGTRHEHTTRHLSLVKVKTHRFAGIQSYGTFTQPPEDFEFEPKASITLFEGGNGSGKTSLVNSIIWCLTGSIYRPQRPPEKALEEFECQIENDTEEAAANPYSYQLSPITPLPDPGIYQPGSNEARIPLDTWVELTFKDQKGALLPVIRRRQSRSSKGKLIEEEPDTEALGLAPIALRIGTIMPALLPYIRLGSQSELGQSVAELTGLSGLMDLARHASKAKARIANELSARRAAEISRLDSQFLQLRIDLTARIEEFPAMRPPGELVLRPDNPDVEGEIIAITDHLDAVKARVLTGAKAILGEVFDSNDSKARANLEENIALCRGELEHIRRLPSAARLAKLAKLTPDQIKQAQDLISTIRYQAGVFEEIASKPALARRKQLYARVAEWIRNGERGQLTNLQDCAVCGTPLDSATDPLTGRSVALHLSEALEANTDFISQTIEDWAKSSLGVLARDLALPLQTETQTDLPGAPADLIRSAIVDELFASECFLQSLAPLQGRARDLCNVHLGALTAFEEKLFVPLPPKIARLAIDLGKVLLRLERTIEFAHWRHANQRKVGSAFRTIVGGSGDSSEATLDNGGPPLSDLLSALEETVKSTTPMNAALGICRRMSDCLVERRKKEGRQTAYQLASRALDGIIALGELAQQQATDLQAALFDRTVFWLNSIYQKTQTSGYELHRLEVNARGSLQFLIGADGASAPAQHVANASALRANLMGFFLAFREHVLMKHGGLNLLVLDDPQDMLDDENRERFARALPEIIKTGGQLVVMTHDREFARLAVGMRRYLPIDSIEHRIVCPLNPHRQTLQIPISVDGLEAKRKKFEREQDNAESAQDYAAEFRIFLEARLSDLFLDTSNVPSKPLTLSDYLGRLRSLARFGANEFVRSPLVSGFLCDPALADGSPFLALLNKAHHRDIGNIRYMDVLTISDDLNRIRLLVLEVHDEAIRWRRREPTGQATQTPIPLKAIQTPSFDVGIHADLAAFTNGSPLFGAREEIDERLTGKWFEQKALFFIDSHNLGFSAERGSVAIVELEGPEVEDRRLVIALHGSEVYARRLLRARDSLGYVALAAETVNPKVSPPTKMFPASSVQIHRIVGFLFDERLQPPRTKEEAILIEHSPCLRQIETAFRVRDDSALPLALPGQVILGGADLQTSDLPSHEGRLAAVALDDGTSLFKRIGPALPGSLSHVRMFKSVGGLGDAQLVMTETVENRTSEFRLMVACRLVLGVLYRD